MGVGVGGRVGGWVGGWGGGGVLVCLYHWLSAVLIFKLIDVAAMRRMSRTHGSEPRSCRYWRECLLALRPLTRCSRGIAHAP